MLRHVSLPRIAEVGHPNICTTSLLLNTAVNLMYNCLSSLREVFAGNLKFEIIP